MKSDARAIIRPATTLRSCGTCSLCCKLYEIPELDKPSHVWCRHCRPGKGGCSIYQERPPVCVDFRCLWLTGQLGDEWWPPRSKIVVTHYWDEEGNFPIMKFSVDANYPNRWREEPYYSQIKGFSAIGWNRRESEMFRVIVSVRGTTFHIFPTRDIEQNKFGSEMSKEEEQKIDAEFALVRAELNLESNEMMTKSLDLVLKRSRQTYGGREP
jgi:hypothetical protein